MFPQNPPIFPCSILSPIIHSGYIKSMVPLPPSSFRKWPCLLLRQDEVIRWELSQLSTPNLPPSVPILSSGYNERNILQSFQSWLFHPGSHLFFNLLNQLSLLSSVSSTSSSVPSFPFTIAFKQLKKIRPSLLSAPLPLHSQISSLYAGWYWLIWIVIS